jgi:hypothetical protein
LRVNGGQRLLVGDEAVSKVFLKWVRILELLKVLTDIKVEELNSNLEDLVIVEFHHHKHVLKARIADLDALVVAVDCNL